MRLPRLKKPFRLAPEILPDNLVSDVLLRAAEEIINAHGADVAFTALSDADSAALLLFLTDDEHIRYFLELRFTNLISYLLTAVVKFDSYALIEEPVTHSFRGVHETV